ncbi:MULTISPECIES: LysR family transcriptional regulator [unclassified Herbaspirillum]|uniref:LysR family transcriptional regulator n=1 Tax=unclassified Herbaspirillum TaxID=2624150 RepID=UPI0011516A7C|nr:MULTISPECIES: LysR family transcriptional regulator [unclassified Herbaspirillum]MBB5393937.1 DNA-binding transcriptional LysR family regulator [Herbaspirillum sp. SJZ102]TQK00027.1 LysR family transcriptional regulator [Herbaspirillum sp. SJZ130]TQK04649.1 LysR family transcriptional regulator [Herbaspirillum sp. SJZ106]
MDIVQLRAFITVAREGNLTRAAEKLHVSQPAVSLQIKSLQEQLGLALFTRTAAGMVLTVEGNKLLPLAERVLADLQELRRHAGALQTSADRLSGSLAIGTILDPEFIRLGAFLKLLVERHPQLSTKLSHHISGSVLNEIRHGRLDVGFFLGDPGKGFHAMTLTPFTYNVIAPAGWKSRVSGKGWKELSRLPWIWTPPESAHHRLLSKVFAQHKVQPDTVALVDQESSMLDLVKSGVGLSLARESIALSQAHAHGLVIADAVDLSTELRFVSLEKRQNENAIKAAFQVLQEIWKY